MKNERAFRVEWSREGVRRIWSIALSIALCAAIVLPAPGALAKAKKEVKLYVSASGNDANDGTLSKPFASLERARDKIRSLKQAEGSNTAFTVYIREGNYRLDKSFQLNDQDSGTPESPIVYQAYQDEQVVIQGGATLKGSSFKTMADELADEAIRNRLPESSRSSVVWRDITDLGIADYGDPVGNNSASPIELYYNAKPFELAGWPNNKQYVRVGQVEDNGSAGNGFIFQYTDPRPSHWLNTGDIWMYGYWFYDWDDQSVRVDWIHPDTQQIKSVQSSPYNIRSDQRYRYFNVLEELDAPGEWYLDRTKNRLYLYPDSPIASADAQLSLLKEPLISLNHASHLTFSHLTLESTRGDAVRIEGGSDIVVADSVLRNIGAMAVVINNSVNSGAVNCTVYNTGTGGIYLNGGDRQTLTPGNLFALNNEIYNFSLRKKTYSPAVQLLGVGNVVSHNDIHDAPHTAILGNGNNHVIEYNDIYKVVSETSDAGAIYFGRDWSEQGNIIRYNYFHDFDSIGGIGQMAIYMDDGSSGFEMYGNIIANVYRGIMINGGREHTIENNILINTDDAIWARNSCATESYLRNNLSMVPYQSEPWKRYPYLPNILDDGPCLPKHNVIQRNVIYKSPDLNLAPAVYEYGTVANNWKTDEDLKFVNMAGGDLTLKKKSPIYDHIPDFSPIPFGAMGRQKAASDKLLEDDPFDSVDVVLPVKLVVGHTERMTVMGNTKKGQYVDLYGNTAYSGYNTSLISIDERTGLIHALAEGSTSITLKAEYGGVKRKVKLPITVSPDYVNRIQLQSPARSLGQGETLTVSLIGYLTSGQQTGLDGFQLEYASDNEQIAVVNATTGVVQGISAGIVNLSAKATAPDGSVLHATPISLIVSPDEQLPAPWKVTNYNNSSGYALYHQGTDAYTVVSDGANVWNTDDFTFVHQPVAAGNNEEISMVATIDSLGNTDPNAAAGIMFRESESPDAKEVNFRIIPGGNLLIVWRAETGGTANYSEGPVRTLPVRIKLSRVGNVFTGYLEEDGVWKKAVETTVQMAPTFQAGLLVFSASETKATSAAFSHVTIESASLVLNKVEVVASKPNLSVGQTAALSLKGYANDTIPIDLTGADISYSSSNVSVAEVDETTGVVKAISTGTATIAAAVTLNGVTVTGTVDLTVSVPTLGSIDLSGSKTAYTAGEQGTLTVRALRSDGEPVAGNEAATTFGSDNESVAKVDADGRVTAVSNGVAKITVTMSLGGVTKSKSLMIIVGSELFREDFEGGLDPGVWNVMYSSASPTISTEMSRSGSHSFKMDKDMMAIRHVFDSPITGVFEAWFYDNLGAENMTGALVDSRFMGMLLNGSQYVGRYSDRYPTSTREKGWHQIAYVSTGSSVNVYIDGVFSYSIGLPQMSNVELGDFWEDQRISNTYFDDVAAYDVTASS